MSDDNLAEQLEAMRDDPEAWGEPEQEQVTRSRKSERRQRGIVVSVRLTPEELSTIQAHAGQNGSTVSGYLRDTALEIARNPVIMRPWMSGFATNFPGTDERLLLRWTRSSFPGVAVPDTKVVASFGAIQPGRCMKDS